MPIIVIDHLEVIDVEEDQGKRASVSLGSSDLALQKLEQKALVVDLGEPVDDREPIDFFVVEALDVAAAEELEDRTADFHVIATAKRQLLNHLGVVEIGAIGGFQIHHA